MRPLIAAIDEGNFNLASPVTGTPFAGLAPLRLPSLISFGINALLFVGALGFFIYLVIGGLQWIFSGGEKEGVEKARKKVTNSLIGLAIMFSAYAILYVVGLLFLGNTNGILTLPIPKI